MIVALGLGSDWHIGASSDKQIKRCIAELKAKNPDVIVLLGDFNGGKYGAKAVRSIIRMVRAEFPDTPIVVCLGNHDFWVAGRKVDRDDLVQYSAPRHSRPRPDVWARNYDDILKYLKEVGAHFLDEDGPWRSEKFPGLVLFGHTLWYDNKYPPTNDKLYMPVNLGGDTDAYMYNKGWKAVEAQLDLLKPEDTIRVFCSHFPVVYPNGRFGGDVEYGGPEWIGNMLRDQFGVRYFLNGHCHQLWEGPSRFECGSDYGRPKAIIVPVSDDPVSKPEPADKPE